MFCSIVELQFENMTTMQLCETLKFESNLSVFLTTAIFSRCIIVPKHVLHKLILKKTLFVLICLDSICKIIDTQTMYSKPKVDGQRCISFSTASKLSEIIRNQTFFGSTRFQQHMNIRYTTVLQFDRI